MQFLKNKFTYADLSGKRKPRRYFVAAILIVFLLVIIAVFSQVQRSQARAEVHATPRPLTAEAAIPDRSNMPSASDAEVQAPSGCPTDPVNWTFQDIFPGENLKRLAPDCVYTGLAQTVAWHMLERMGYTKTEAAEMLAFVELPYRPAERVRALTSLKGPLDLAVTMEWGPHPDYRYWTLDETGGAGLAYSLSGCYRAQTVVGNQVEAWGLHSVHCLVVVDYAPGWTVHELGEYRFSANWADQPGARSFVLFGYAGDGPWELVGELPDLYAAHDQLGEDLAGERQAAADRHGLPVWDPEWLFDTYGFEPYPLTEGWQLMTDPAALGPMGEELNLYAEAPQ